MRAKCTFAVHRYVITPPTFVTVGELGRTPAPNGVADILGRRYDHGEEEDNSHGVASVETVHGVVVRTEV